MDQSHKPSENATSPMGPRPLTVEEVAEWGGWSRSFVYQQLEAGKLASIRAGRTRRIPVEALKAFVAAHTSGSIVG